tara:strand:+ start:244 stop:471 length:228 start_codon:yes stop_codon:yes gene_type:complete
MVGGGLKSMLPKKNKELYMILAGLVIILLKVFAVQWSYNLIWPKLVRNNGDDTSNFEPLTFYEAFIFVILISFLF